VHPWSAGLLAGPFGQFPAGLGHGHSGPVCGGADVQDRGEECVLPEVVGLPPGDLVEQVRLGAAVKRGGGEHRVLELAPVLASPRILGQEPFPRPFQGYRVCTARSCPGERIGGEAEEDFAEKGAVARMQRLQLSKQVRQSGVPGKSCEQQAPLRRPGIPDARSRARSARWRWPALRPAGGDLQVHDVLSDQARHGSAADMVGDRARTRRGDQRRDLRRNKGGAPIRLVRATPR